MYNVLYKNHWTELYCEYVGNCEFVEYTKQIHVRIFDADGLGHSNVGLECSKLPFPSIFWDLTKYTYKLLVDIKEEDSKMYTSTSRGFPRSVSGRPVRCLAHRDSGLYWRLLLSFSWYIPRRTASLRLIFRHTPSMVFSFWMRISLNGHSTTRISIETIDRTK